MELIINSILKMSISSCFIIAAVILFRKIFKTAPRWMTGVLWALVLIRLVCPFAIESRFSLVPDFKMFNQKNYAMSEEISDNENVYKTEYSEESAYPKYEVNQSMENDLAGDATTNENSIVAEHAPAKIHINIETVLFIIWLTGFGTMNICGIISYLRIKKNVRDAVKYKDNIYMSEWIKSPFVLGLIRPVIYIRYGLSKEQADYIIEHEMAHIKRKDNYVKFIAWFVLTVHFFNPLVWVAYALLSYDIELATDEKVIDKIGLDKRTDYLETLLQCSIDRKKSLSESYPAMLAFAEVGLKERVKNIMNMRKASKAVIIASAICCMGIAVGCMTDKDDTVVNDVAVDDIVVMKVSDTELENADINSTEISEISDTSDNSATEAEEIKDDSDNTDTEDEYVKVVVDENYKIDFENGETILTVVKNSIVKDGEYAVVTTDDDKKKISYPVSGNTVITRDFVASHPEVDFAAPEGTDVIVAESGVVIDYGFDEEYGNYIIIKSVSGKYHIYSHLKDTIVTKEQAVSTGNKIGTVGNTGKSTGPHLSFMIIEGNGTFLKPQFTE